MDNIFLDIAIITIVATVGGYIARIFKQPLIPLYILAGLLIGPVLGIITNADIITKLSEFGIAFLLFIVGLEIDFKRLKETTHIAIFGGIFQTFVFGAIAFFIARSLGFEILESIYLSLIVAFSSTMIVLKLLSDKKELDTLHGRIIIGLLLIQDIFAIIALSILTSINSFSFFPIAVSVLEGFLGIIIAIIAGRFIFPIIFKYASRSPEILMLSSLSILFAFCIFFNYLGLSIAIGAFIAGISLANLSYSPEIIARIKPLKDFFATIFFVSLGLTVSLGSVAGLWPIIIIFSALVIFAKPLTIMIMSGIYGYRKNTSFLTGISLAQISEFSLIIVTLGYTLGHISISIVSMTSIIAMITITISAYLITYSKFLTHRLSRILKIFERKNPIEHGSLPEKEEYQNHIILFGCDRVGQKILDMFAKKGEKIVVIDYNPEIIKSLKNKSATAIYGDMGDLELLNELDLDKVKMVVSTVPDLENNLLILEIINEKNSQSITYTTANTAEEALDLYKAGSDYVILPHFLGGEQAAFILEETGNNLAKIISQKKAHLEELRKRHQEERGG
jgi:Kef-type K+ transport system membrane component KefB/Trk K+ transport system NAD-binding subunit